MGMNSGLVNSKNIFMVGFNILKHLQSHWVDQSNFMCGLGEQKFIQMVVAIMPIYFRRVQT